MTSVLPSWMQQLRLDDVPACLDGTPFATAFEAHFAPLVDFEAEHGPVPTEQPDTHAVLDRLGLTGKPFGRERGCWIASTSEYHGDGAWLVVSARNGGHEPECWTDDGDDCRCFACQHYRVLDYPGFCFDETEGGDNSYFFELPADLHHRVRLRPLVVERASMLDGGMKPWEVLPANPANTNRERYGYGAATSKERKQLQDALDDMAEREALLVEFADVLAEPCPETPMVPRRGRDGRKLSGMAFAMISPMGLRDAERYRTKRAKDTDRRAKRAELQAALDMGLPHEAAELIRKALSDEGTVSWGYRLADDTSERIGLHRLAADAKRHPAERDRIVARMAELDAIEARPSDFRYWPGDWASYCYFNRVEEN